MVPHGLILARLLLALVCGGLIGFEREFRGQSAGMKTLSLVSLGSALITVVSIYGFRDVISATPKSSFDPSRIAAQIVTGVGFLGAGAILLRRDVVRGLTTAASVWLVAGIGLSAGAGLSIEAIAATVIALLALLVLRPIEQRIFPAHSAHRVRLRVEPATADAEVLAQMRAIFARTGVGVQSLELRPTRNGQIIDVSCRVRRQEDLVTALTDLHALTPIKAMRADLVYSAFSRFERGRDDADVPSKASDDDI